MDLLPPLKPVTKTPQTIEASLDSQLLPLFDSLLRVPSQIKVLALALLTSLQNMLSDYITFYEDEFEKDYTNFVLEVKEKELLNKRLYTKSKFGFLRYKVTGDLK